MRAGQKTGPPVMEFDAAGNYVQGWGGPGQGYEWPRRRTRHLRGLQGQRLDFSAGGPRLRERTETRS